MTPSLRLPLPFLLGLLLPALTSAQCAACDSYTGALTTCQTNSVNVTAVGTTMDTPSIHCMCATHSNTANMNACTACWEANPTVTFDETVLTAWTTTCRADGQYGDQQAALCWEGQPTNFLPCVVKTGGSGSSTPAGSGGAATGTSAANSPSATAAKSDAALLCQVSRLLSIMAVGLGVVLVA